MKIKMLVDAKGSANISGNAIKQYTKDEKSNKKSRVTYG